MNKIGNFLNKHANKIAFVAMVAIMICGTVFAEQVDRAEQLWDLLAELLEKWVTRLGAVVALIGGVMFGLGWKNDDPTQKTNGISTFIAGVIVIAVAALTSTFFA